MTQLDVAFVMPHPDDIEITSGGTVAKLVKLGYRVGMFHMTDGEPTPRGTPEVRAAELQQAGAVLGAHVVEVLGLTNRELMDSPATRYVVATAFRRYRPAVVVCMAGRTPAASPDHYQGQLIVEAARFYSQLTKWDDRFAGTEPYQVPWLWYRPLRFAAEQHHFHSTFVVDVSDVYEQKIAAVSCYRSQFDEKRLARLLHGMRSSDATDGGRAGFEYGELFALPTPLPMKDPFAAFSTLRPPTGPTSRPY